MGGREKTGGGGVAFQRQPFMNKKILRLRGLTKRGGMKRVRKKGMGGKGGRSRTGVEDGCPFQKVKSWEGGGQIEKKGVGRGVQYSKRRLIGKTWRGEGSPWLRGLANAGKSRKDNRRGVRTVLVVCRTVTFCQKTQ